MDGLVFLVVHEKISDKKIFYYLQSQWERFMLCFNTKDC